MRIAMMSLPWKRLYKIGKPFWVSERKWIGLAHFAAVLLFLFANAAVAVYVNKAAGNFMTSIEQRSTANFYHYLMVYGGALLLLMPIQVAYAWFRTRMALIWRLWLAENLMSRYYSNRAYYKMLHNRDIDNPDQRMTQDVDSFCNTSVGLFIAVLDSVVNVVSFAAVLWAISPLLTWTVFAYAAIGSAVVMFIGKNLSNLNFQVAKTEADLRFMLAETRREAEAVAMYRGEQVAMAQARSKLRDVITVLFKVMNLWRNVGIFTNPYNALVALIPAALIAPLYFERAIAFGDITQATMAFGAVFGGATFLVHQFGGISGYTATINRLGAFIEALEEAGLEPLPPEKRIDVREGTSIKFEKTSVLTPDLARSLVFDLTVEVKQGQGLLIVGPDGSGKTALSRVIAGVWNAGHGTMYRPPASDIMFMTALPYLPAMTLRQALCFADGELCQDDARLMQVLTVVNLQDLPQRSGGMDVEQNWRQMLSLNEQQRLTLARVILRRPMYVVIDEATAALEAEHVQLLYALLASLGATVISAGNSGGLVKYHAQVLELAGDGSWQLHPADKYTPKPVVRISGLIDKLGKGE